MLSDAFTLDPQGKNIIVKDPDATLDYLWDFGPWLNSVVSIVESPTLEPDFIIAYEIFAVGSPAPIDIGVTGQQDGVIVAFLSGGILGQTHQVTCRIHTAGGRTDDRSVYLRIRSR